MNATKPRLLDAFCGAGGCTHGYQLAGFHVTGVDINPQPRYCGDAFVQGDALAFIRQYGHEYDAIHASPPCQAFTPLKALSPDKSYPDHIATTRELLAASGRPYVIENVVQAPLNGIILCGAMFSLRVYRHRRFESNIALVRPPHPKHIERVAWGRDRKRRYEQGMMISITGDIGSYCGPAMGIDWMNGNELSQAIPPAYTLFIGRHLLDSRIRIS